MLKLFCAVVGTEGSVFPVNIDASKSVSDLKKAIKAKMPSDWEDVDANQLQLFLAKMTDGNWLKNNVPAALKLEEGKKHRDIQTVIDGEKMIATRTLQYWLFEKNKMPQPSTGQVHVLVVAPQRKKSKWMSSPLRPQIYDSESKYFWLEKEITAAAGLFPKRLMLYCRPNFHEQVEFLRERVLKEGHLGWVIGPSGTGKSTTAMAFALTVDRTEWEVIWIHISIHSYWRCVRLIGDERKSRDIINATELEEVLQVDDDSKHRIVLVDDLSDADENNALVKTCNTWFLQKDVVMKRRLAYICIMAYRREMSDHVEILTRAMEYRVYSWTLDEYLAATSDDTFFRVVEPYLGDSVSDRSAMVKAKYFYAGGSCRYMFCYNSTDVVMKVSYAVQASTDLGAMLGLRSQLIVDRLYAMFTVTKDTLWCGYVDYMNIVRPVISRFAAMVIAVECDPDKIENIMSNRRESLNPALNGWILELIFFASICNGGLEIVDAAGNTLEKWSQSRVVESDEIPQLFLDCPVWIMPQKWNEGGCDAIMVCKNTGLVRMVQVTSADTHIFRIDYFYSWLAKLQQSNPTFEIKTLEIIFVVEREKLSDFKFSTVTGEGLLEPFGWHKFTEAHRAKKVGIRRLYNFRMCAGC